MQILPKEESSQGPQAWFTGEVTLTPLKGISASSDLSITKVSFKPGARSAWHMHPKGQTLYVTDGVGVIQKRGEGIQHIKSGDVIWTEPGEEHWHGASKDQSITHLAIQEIDQQGNLATWGEHVTDEEYTQAI